MWTSIPATMVKDALALFKRLVRALERIAEALEDANKR